MEPYYTIVLPYVAARFATQWHPTEATGPLSTLTRGAFPTEADALVWAQTRLNGTPYSIRLIKDEPNE
jgi:hypothetical protein